MFWGSAQDGCCPNRWRIMELAPSTSKRIVALLYSLVRPMNAGRPFGAELLDDG
jgi:hypothetical protein